MEIINRQLALCRLAFFNALEFVSNLGNVTDFDCGVVGAIRSARSV